MPIYSANHPATRTEVCIFQGDLFLMVAYIKGFPGGSVVKKPPAKAEGLGSTPGLGRSPGERNGYPLQSSDLENSMDRGAWQAAVHGVARSLTRLESDRY